MSTPHRGLSAAVVLVIAIGSAVAARADTVLPEGWVRGETEVVQTADAQRPALRGTPIEIDLDRLPAASTEVPSTVELGLYDAHGRPRIPPLQRSTASETIRMTPPGRAGFVRLGEDASLLAGAFFRDPAVAGQHGFGPEYTFNANVPPDQPLYWQSLDQHPDGGLRFRSVDGRFDRRTGVTSVNERFDARAIDVADGVVFAFRAIRGEEDVVDFVMPPASVLFDDDASRIAPRAGDTFFGDAFTLVELRLGEGRSSSVGLSISSFVSNRWRASGGPELAFDGVIVLSATRARGEAKPTVMVALTGRG